MWALALSPFEWKRRWRQVVVDKSQETRKRLTLSILGRSQLTEIVLK